MYDDDDKNILTRTFTTHRINNEIFSNVTIQFQIGVKAQKVSLQIADVSANC